MPTPTDLSDLYIELAPVSLPAFGSRTSDRLNYSSLQKAGITSLRILPTITATHLSGENLVHVDCHVVDPVFTEGSYGLVCGDMQLQQAIDAHVRKVLHLPGIEPLCYADRRQQTPTKISLDAGWEWSNHFEGLSHHRLLEMTRYDGLTALHLGPLAWGSSPARS